MFVVTVEDVDYSVEFRHQWKGKPTETVSEEEFEGTMCVISFGPKGTHPKDMQECSVGVAFLNPRDNPNRAIGRKVSLARAIDEAVFTKETRRVFWQKYLEKTRK